jgi:hypothetical protein
MLRNKPPPRAANIHIRLIIGVVGSIQSVTLGNAPADDSDRELVARVDLFEETTDSAVGPRVRYAADNVVFAERKRRGRKAEETTRGELVERWRRGEVSEPRFCFVW